MNAAQLSRIEKIISKGKWHYIFFHGVIGWGVSTAVLFSLIQAFIKEIPFTETLALSFVLFPLGGIAWGALMWGYLTKSYDKAQNTEKRN